MIDPEKITGFLTGNPAFWIRRRKVVLVLALLAITLVIQKLDGHGPDDFIRYWRAGQVWIFRAPGDGGGPLPGIIPREDMSIWNYVMLIPAIAGFSVWWFIPIRFYLFFPCAYLLIFWSAYF